jgi:GntR family transcriptional regulator / MocR family aminotransferase
MSNRKTTSGALPAAPELLIRVNRASGPGLRAQVERELREAIRTRRLPPGAELPSTRALASDLGISRGIVVEAYEQLLAEGYLAARRGSATTVAPGRVAPDRDSTAAVPASAAESARAAFRYDFRPSVPDTSAFPRRAWHKSLRKVLATATNAELDYPDPRGTRALRVALSGYLNRVRGTAALPEHMLMCNGFTQGFRLVCAVLKQRGARAVATEDPSHEEQRAAIRAAGLKVVAVRVDDKGVVVERLERTAANAILVTPAHQFPTGSVLAPERRAALLEWARRRRGFVIEDDYDAEFRYDREPIGSLQGVAPERVVYVGSASKTLAPALRLGWLVAPAELLEDLARVKEMEDRGSPSIEQLAFADFLERGELDRHLRRMRLIYRRRRDLLTKALRTHAPQRRVFGIAAGLNLMLELAPAADERAIAAAAAELSVHVGGVHRYCVRPGAPALILGYGMLRDSAIAEGIKRLASVIERRSA